MEKLEIVTAPFETLNTKAHEVDTETLRTDLFQTFAQNLLHTLEQTPHGGGLAANQVNELHRIFAVNLSEEDGIELKQLFINPEITFFSDDTEVSWEGCLSIPGKWGKVERSKKIRITAQNLKGEEFTLEATDFYARLMQHELDHLNGILYTEKVIGDVITSEELEKLQEEKQKEASY